MTSTALILLVLALFAVSGGAATAASLPADTTAILSGAPSLLEPFPAPAGESYTGSAAVSQDGRYVAFESTSDGLVDGDNDLVGNIYVKDTQTGTVTLASRRTGEAGAPADSDCVEPTISDDGLRVAFTCWGSLDPADTNAFGDVYVRDLETATTTLVSRASGLGQVGNSDSTQPSLSEQGNYVAFTSYATNLNPAAVSGIHVYRRQIGLGNDTILVTRRSVGDGNTPVDGERPSISDDGNRIAFTQTPAVPGDSADTNGFDDVYVRDVAAGTSILASRAAGSGAVGNGASYSPAIAGDGSAVAFESQATNFDDIQDSDSRPDVYWRSLAPGGNTALVDVNAAGHKAYESYAPSIDDSGWQVGFVAKATELDPADTDTRADTYVKNLLTNALQIASRADGSSGAVANADATAVSVSGNGGRVASSLARGITPDADPRLPNVILRELSDTQHTFTIGRPAGDAPFVSLGGRSYSPALSSDGRYAAFVSEAPGLGLPFGITSAVFVRDRVTGAVTLASRADGPGGAPFNGNVYGVAISGNGRRVAFAFAEGYSPAQVWVRDLDAEKTYLASRADGAAGAEANGDSNGPALDADGSRVVFTSYATNLGDGDTDGISDVHVRDLADDRTILVSRADGADGPKGNDGSRSGAINADGTRVAFASEATNLGDGDTDDVRDVHLRDLAAGTTRLVSATPAGVKTDRSAAAPSIDAEGTRIAFESVATNLVSGTVAEKRKVFVRDLAADTLVLASRADGPDGAAPDSNAENQRISPDGRYVAFVSDASNLGTVVPATEGEVYRRDLAAGTTRLVSRRSGASGAPAQDFALVGGISAGGGCVSFVTRDALLGPPSEYFQAYLRVFRADCVATDPDPAPTADAGAGGSTAGGGRPAGSTTGKSVAPALSGVALTRKRFRVGPGATALSAAIGRGTMLRFKSSVVGRLTIVVERVRHGRPAYRRAGTFTRRVTAGPGRVRLTGRLGRRALRPGRYRLTVSVADATGKRSKPVRLRFVIVR